MFAGHVGAGLAIAGAERRLNVGVFIAAALLLDLVLWVFVLLGWESVAIPADFAHTHQAAFVFPYSHGLRVEATAEFAGIGLAARHIRYRAVVSSSASAEAVAELLRHTDAVAEVHNTIRAGGPVELIAA